MKRPLTSTELREKYRQFFVERGHAPIPSASLVPANNPTVLFTTAGMHPLVPYLLGQPHPAGRRLSNVQRCVRTGDIDLIGDNTHLTFFEMLGNWSLGDYGRPESIRWSFEFLTLEPWLDLPLERIGVTCFEGDLEAAEIWASLGLPRERIQFLGREDNWWGPAGKIGPCGPDTEIFFWIDDSPPPERIDVRDERWVEIWNNVFMSHEKTPSGAFEPLPRMNVDTGMGLERALVAINGSRSVYEVDTVAPLFEVLGRLASRHHEHEQRVLTDHLRAACFMIQDGVGPSNKDRGYVVRRLVRRCLLCAQRLGMPADWFRHGVAAVVGPDSSVGEIEETIAEELGRFERTLAQGLRILEKFSEIDGKTAFDLCQTHGFPFELTCELAGQIGKQVDREGYVRELERHRAVSRATGEHRGGLADHSDQSVRYHTLTHLLQASLREVLGPHVIQRGSNITHERLRFDFAHDSQVSKDDLARVEAIVNRRLAQPLVVERSVMSEPEARALGAIGAFGEKYGETVSVYTISARDTGEVVSREFCGGPHVASTAELEGRFRITKEQGISAGVRRIKAVLAVSVPVVD
jgi:alanyl-tRNA synthetase